jgi:excinuclease ABC subunit A
VTDRLAELGGLAEPNWGDRSTVELLAESKEGGWFLHALTGDEWLLVLKFRVGRGTFDEATLARRLGLRALDDIDELPVYGRVPRVRVANPKGPWQEVAVTVHWLREIDTPEFDDFLREAHRSYLARIEAAAQLDVADLTPWKVLGRKWHLTSKGFPGPRRAAWSIAVLESLFALLELVAPGAQVDWTRKTSVVYLRPDGAAKWAEVHTKRREGIDLELAGPPGRFALGRIAALGHERELRSDLLGDQTIRIRFVQGSEVAAPDLKVFLVEHLAACRG